MRESADHILFRTYWGLMIPDVLHELGFDATKENKAILHEFHKRILGYKSTSGMPQAVMSTFLQEVCLFWATEFGIFVRTSAKQMKGIEWLPFKKVKDLL